MVVTETVEARLTLEDAVHTMLKEILQIPITVAMLLLEEVQYHLLPMAMT